MIIDDPNWPRADAWLGSASAAPQLVVAGVPSSSASLTPSEAWRAPAAVRAALGRLAVFDGETGVDLRSVAVHDLGDWDVSGLDMTEAPRVVERYALTLTEPDLPAGEPLPLVLDPAGIRFGVASLDE